MTDVVVGYTGGSSLDPTYDAINDHTESIRITFDPRHVSLEQIYQFFWQEHTPAPSYFGRQYR